MPQRREFTSHMMKEIFEQPAAVLKTALDFQSGQSFQGAGKIASILPGVNRIMIAASGTSRHAGMIGKYILESLTGLTVQLEFASEFQHAHMRIGGETLVIVITQSGETADTLGSLRKARLEGATVIAISNVAESSIMREADARVETKAGPEIAIPSTKAFTAQITALYMLSWWLAERIGAVSASRAQGHVAEILSLPEQLNTVLSVEPQVLGIAREYLRANDFLVGGYGIHYPIALDGALKLKEVAYVHAEGFALGEIKHGPMAMIDDTVVTVLLLTCDRCDPESVIRYEKSLSMAREIKNRGSRIVCIANQGDAQAPEIADDLISIPTAPELLMPMLEIVPLQLLAHHIASLLGNDVDRPRSLVKSVVRD